MNHQQGMSPVVYGIPVSHEYPGVTCSIERIAPEIAEEMLKLNTHNRDRKREPLTKAINDGEWVLNGATIVFSDQGVLLDGQNRLYACIASKTPIDTIVVRGIHQEAQETMDTNVRRSIADYLKMRGYPDYPIVGAIGGAIYRADLGGVRGAFHTPNANEFTLKSCLHFIEENYEDRILPVKPFCKNLSRRYRGFNTGTSGVLLDAFRAAGDENMEDFAKKLYDADQSVNGISLLSNQLINNAMSKTGKLPQWVIAALVIKVWNSYITGNEMKCLRFTSGGANPERFPEIQLGYDV